uniref:Uncharacterized protein n=1 Tax=Eutreptiella gymnastica TaxID=73025 RepID=A0A7S4LCP3_9EUGL
MALNAICPPSFPLARTASYQNNSRCRFCNFWNRYSRQGVRGIALLTSDRLDAAHHLDQLATHIMKAKATVVYDASTPASAMTGPLTPDIHTTCPHAQAMHAHGPCLAGSLSRQRTATQCTEVRYLP